MPISFIFFRWNVSDFSNCSKSCGGGIQTRSVTCIQEVRHGGSNILRVDDSFCPQPPPITQQFCHVVDCKPTWKIGPWSKVISKNRLDTLNLFHLKFISVAFFCNCEKPSSFHPPRKSKFDFNNHIGRKCAIKRFVS